MAYTPDDPAKDRRITRLSLVSSAAIVVANLKEVDTPAQATDTVLALARDWEKWILEFSPGMGEEPPPAALPLVCAQCALPLSVVQFRDGRKWGLQQLAENGMSRHGKVLCKTHYFEANRALQPTTP